MKQIQNVLKITIAAMLLSSAVYAQHPPVRISWTGELNCEYYPLDSVVVTNKATGEKVVFYYPDTSYTTYSDVAVKPVPPDADTRLKTYPNPFSDKVQAEFSLAQKGEADLAVYDVLGREIVRKVCVLERGTHVFNLSLPQGAYTLHLQTAEGKQSARLLSEAKGSPAPQIAYSAPLSPPESTSPNPSKGGEHAAPTRHCGLDPQSPANKGILKQVQNDDGMAKSHKSNEDDFPFAYGDTLVLQGFIGDSSAFHTVPLIADTHIVFAFFSIEEPLDSLVLIAQGNVTGREGIFKQNLVITSDTAWQNLITTMNLVNNVSDSFTEINIDFLEYQVIAVFDKLKLNGGWTIDITDITEDVDSTVITIQNLGKGDSNSVQIIRPFCIIKIPLSEKNIVFQMNTDEENPISGCDCKDELFYYYHTEKRFFDTDFLNDYLLIVFDTLIQDSEIVNYINQIDLFNTVDTNKIYTLKEYRLLFTNTTINRSCSQLKELISFVEKNPLITLANLTFNTDAWFSGVYMDVMFFTDEFIVQLWYVNDLSNLNAVVQETNTRIKSQNIYRPDVYIIGVDKNSNGNALQMSQYFSETGKFVYADPNFTWAKINR